MLTKQARFVGRMLTIATFPIWFSAALIYRTGQGIDWLGHWIFDACIDVRDEIIGIVQRITTKKE